MSTVASGNRVAGASRSGTPGRSLFARYPYSDARRRALTAASARRELWRAHHAMSTRRLGRELAVHAYNADPASASAPYRSDHLRSVDTWYVRMIRTELRRRGVRPSC